MKKKILFYCQHILGMGHLVRSMEIVRGLADDFQVCFINGGEQVPGFDVPAGIEVINLPAIKTDAAFRALTVVGGAASEVRARLYSHIQRLSPAFHSRHKSGDSDAFANLAGKGNLGGLVIGQPPRVTRSDLGNKFQDPDGAVHLEIFYRIRLTDRISITPGLLTIFNPENNRNNPTVQVGTLRATFDF
ncbi:MAG: carbohydrate porin [Aphanocapsa lilacina HA4352-LM1]|jgi:hypothetical protein|nr:carbohydrate porin [Aphanocapsa lilacina HA4352-LM1]